MSDNPYNCESCDDDAVFWVYERYEAEDGFGAVEAEVCLCRECVDDAGPQHLDGAYANYEFRIDPVAEAFGMRQL